MVEAFRQASIRGWEYAVNHPLELVELIQAKYNTQGKSYEHLLFEAQSSNELVFSELVPIGYMNKDRWQRIEAVFRQQGLMNEPINYDQFLYKKSPNNPLAQLLYQYRLQIAAVVILFLGSLIALHNLHLRRQVALRTRELEESRLKAEAEARTDWLTGLPNRRHFIESVKQYIGQAERRGTDLVMLSLDLDYFKKINDTYGHAAGDAALIEIAKQLKQHVRKDDVVARLGGEEFSIICLDTDESRAWQLAERVSAAIVDSKVSYGTQEISCTVSVGMAFWEPGDSYDALLNKADEAMYLAKANGRNQIKLIKPAVTPETSPGH